jgi:hypothetical protein
MHRIKQTYWQVKEEKNYERELQRSNRRMQPKFHLDYSSMMWWKALNNLHRPYHGAYKQYDAFKGAMEEAIRDFPEFFTT